MEVDLVKQHPRDIQESKINTINDAILLTDIQLLFSCLYMGLTSFLFITLSFLCIAKFSLYLFEYDQKINISIHFHACRQVAMKFVGISRAHPPKKCNVSHPGKAFGTVY